MKTIWPGLVALALTGTLAACSQGTPGTFTSGVMTCSGDIAAPRAIELTANATPPREVPGGTLRLESAGTQKATLWRSPGEPRAVTVSVGETFTVGSVTYTLVGSCAVRGDNAPGSTTGMAYVVAAG